MHVVVEMDIDRAEVSDIVITGPSFSPDRQRITGVVRR